MIPPNIFNGLIAYVEDGIPTGHFLHAVLCNDLFEAMGRADMDSRVVLHEICEYVWNHLPGNCWGSAAKVTAWIDAKRNERLAKERKLEVQS